MQALEKTRVRSKQRWIMAGLLTGLGMVLFCAGFYLETRNPRTNAEDDFAWLVLGLGTSLTAAGISLPFARGWVVGIIALLAPLVAFFLAGVVFWAAVFWSAAWSEHWPEQRIVRSGYPLISQAGEMDALFDSVWHQTSNYQAPNSVEWISRALFAGRYELTMRLRVEVDRKTGQITKLLEEPQFQLGEVTQVQGRAISYGRWHEFDAQAWEKVMRAGGDFSVIGIPLDRDHPLPGFAKYKKTVQLGIRMDAK